MSSFASRKLKGSLTVEAAFALPLFLFFILQVMSVINMIGMQSRLSAALHQTGNQMAFAGYAYEKMLGNVWPEGIASTTFSTLYARDQILDHAGRGYLDKSCMENGAAGLSFTGTSIMEHNDMIEICLSYQIEPMFPIMGFASFAVEQNYYGRAWTGYDVENGISDLTENDPMVYVTETGTVYHTDRNCTYLNPSIEMIRAADIDGNRNQSGGKYYACELCGIKNAEGMVYITDQGNSYHCSMNCSGLKRTIYTIPLSQTNGRGHCSKCR
ncbi:MAG: pilus assembly protein [Roseburia sp.]|nr:pilus assembly protein [Roseburia sp.]MCM1241658.1 pilus assembly protein [Roseburia sp.]